MIALQTRDIVMFNGAGKPLARVPMGSNHESGLVSQTIKRAHLHRALHEEAVRRGVRMESGKRLANAQPIAGGGVRAEFTDGSSATGDLLVGCDGIHSRTRSVIDPVAPRPRYVGLLNFGGYVPQKAIGEPGAWHMVFGTRAFFGYVPDRLGGTVWFANIPRAAATETERERMTAEDFWEVGASGTVYPRHVVLDVLERRYADQPDDPWEVRDFAARPLGGDTWLVTYELDQAGRLTRRATIWRSTVDGWLALYHQGTLMPGTSPDG